MKNTLVTAIYFSSPMSRMGGRGYDFEFYEAPFRNIINLGCNLVVYSHSSEINKIENFFKKYNFVDYKIIDFDLNQYKHSDKIYELKEIGGLIDENGLVSDRDYMSNDRNHHLCLLKPYFLKHTIENNLFESENYYWVDAGLFHHGIFPETHGGIERFTKVKDEKYWPILENNICNPTLLERLENKNKTDFIFMGIDGYCGATPWYYTFTDINKMSHIIGGLFGGKKEIVLELEKEFDEMTTKIFNENILTLEEEVLSMLYSISYNKYKHISFKTWYHDVPTVPNYFGTSTDSECFYKIFI